MLTKLFDGKEIDFVKYIYLDQNKECFGMLVDVKHCNCKNNSLKRLIRNAEFDQPEAVH